MASKLGSCWHRLESFPRLFIASTCQTVPSLGWQAVHSNPSRSCARPAGSWALTRTSHTTPNCWDNARCTMTLDSCSYDTMTFPHVRVLSSPPDLGSHHEATSV
ncbi:hypothetical protein IG631_22653 [Alternaria alternata]|nr:hypothetical protein IG631_22653 [Alternaria alternata]